MDHRRKVDCLRELRQIRFCVFLPRFRDLLPLSFTCVFLKPLISNIAACRLPQTTTRTLLSLTLTLYYTLEAPSYVSAQRDP